jgi:hypothetical protein
MLAYRMFNDAHATVTNPYLCLLDQACVYDAFRVARMSLWKSN